MRKKVVSFLIIMTFFAYSCATIKNAREAQNPDQAKAGEKTITAEQAGILPGEVLSMDGALDTAMKYNSGLAQSRYQVEASKKQEAQANARWWPWASGSASYTHTEREVPEDQRTPLSPDSVQKTDSKQVGAQADWTVFDFGRKKASVDQAKANREAAEEMLRATQDDVRYQVKAAYYEVLRTAAVWEVAQETEDLNRQHLERTNAFFEVGRATAYEQTKAQLDLSTAKEDTIKAEGGARTARTNLNRLLGLAEDADYEVAEPAWVEPETDLAALWARTRENNPELAAMRHYEEAASAAVDYSVADLFPELSVSGSAGYSGTDYPLTWSWSVGPNLTFTLFKGGAAVRLVDQRAAELRAARARVASREQELFAQLSQAVTRAQEARQVLDTAEVAVKQAQENFELVGELYKVQRATALELSDARTSLSRSRSELIAAKASHQTAAALIEKIAGVK